MASIEERTARARKEIREREIRIEVIDKTAERLKALKGTSPQTLATLALSRRASVNNRQSWLDYIKRGCVSG